MTRMLAVENLSRSFGASRVVDSVSFTAAPGAVTGLIGPNGAGKTTLFNLIAGTLRPDQGHVILGGVALDQAGPARRLRQGLARTFQIPRPFKAMTVLENVLVAAQRQSGEQIWPNWFTPGRVAREEHRLVERARELLDFLTLLPLAHTVAGALSGGQRKLLELARALSTEPRIVLLDEPAAGVAPPLLETILDRVEALRAGGMTFLVIEHHMPLVARLCATVHVMAAGRLLVSGTPAEIMADERVRDAYLGEAI